MTTLKELAEIRRTVEAFMQHLNSNNIYLCDYIEGTQKFYELEPEDKAIVIAGFMDKVNDNVINGRDPLAK